MSPRTDRDCNGIHEKGGLQSGGPSEGHLPEWGTLSFWKTGLEPSTTLSKVALHACSQEPFDRRSEDAVAKYVPVDTFV